MSARTPGSLNSTQRKALDALAAYGTSHGREALSKPMGVHANTLYALERLGLVETRHQPICVARLTDDGWKVVGE